MKTGTYVSCDYTPNSVKLLADWCKENAIPEPLDKKHYHTTVLYSRSNVPTAQTIVNYITKDIELSIIGFKLFDTTINPGFAALVLEFEAPQLVALHNLLIANGGTHDYPDYIPHLTISYKVSKDLDLTQFQLPNFKLIVQKFKVEPLNLDWKA